MMTSQLWFGRDWGIPSDAVGVVGTAVVLITGWYTVHSVKMRLLPWTHCAACESPLRYREAYRNLTSPPGTYPFESFDGRYRELPVRALCSTCVEEARELRARLGPQIIPYRPAEYAESDT